MLDGPRLLPQNGAAPEALVVMLHGFGADGDDLIGLAPSFQDILPKAAIVAPHAPDPVPGYPQGRQWFDLKTLSSDEIALGARLAAPNVQAFLEAEGRKYNLPLSKMVLLGFSQGCMMALHVGLRLPQPVAGIIGLSGLLPDPKALKTEIKTHPPVFLAHGLVDDVVPADMTLLSATVLADAGCCPQYRLVPNLPHGIDPETATFAARFAADALSGRCAGQVPPEPVRNPVSS